MEECASGMGQRLNRNDAAVRDARTKFKEEECASGTGQSLNRNDAAVRDAQIKSSMEECASDMGPRSNDAAVMDVLILF
jgi:hypothetical protein